MTRSLTRLAAMLAIASTALLASACAPSAPVTEPEPSETVDASVESPAPEPETTPDVEPAATEEPTCETIIPPETAADFASLGWTNLADIFQVASVQIPEGLQCVWGDFSTATDHVQIYGWAPITAEQAATAENELVADGWIREDSAEGVYITENPETAANVDEQGYGLTYLFGDGWVKYADTKQGIVLVEWSQG
ncbi:hypothetical protein ABZ477_01140 [Microbacterium sp. NPDC019599]|uniref:hypothetical protein n=1 Tax=Microbacterium sp. NPDC019599 TaxID=3154690 RepID=UPI0033CE2882